MPWWLSYLVLPIGASVGGALATKYIVGGSPSQKDIEKQMKLQQQLEIQRMVQQQAVQSQQTQEVGSYLLPALGVVALVMLLK